MGEWRYSSTIFDLGIMWNSAVSFTPQWLYPRERGPCTNWLGGWVGPRTVLENVERRKVFPVLELEL
jgi:hypothetical protein